MNDEAFWCRTDVVERIAGDKGKRRRADRTDRQPLLEVDDLRRLNDVFVVAAERCDPDDVAAREFTETPEERVPMCG
jgi:hypothetical protein